jgi:hypothetical protein
MADKDNEECDNEQEYVLKYSNMELYEADPECEHEVEDAPGGGVRCTKCSGWFCF